MTVCQAGKRERERERIQKVMDLIDPLDEEAGDRRVGPSDIVVDINRALLQDIRKCGFRNGSADIVIVIEGVMCVRGTVVNIVFRHLC